MNKQLRTAFPWIVALLMVIVAINYIGQGSNIGFSKPTSLQLNLELASKGSRTDVIDVTRIAKEYIPLGTSYSQTMEILLANGFKVGRLPDGLKKPNAYYAKYVQSKVLVSYETILIVEFKDGELANIHGNTTINTI